MSLIEYYDPFREKCMPLPTFPQSPKTNYTNTPANCQGLHFSHNEFQVLSNDSILLHPLQKTYPNGSYNVVSQTVILCVSISVKYIPSMRRSGGDKGKPELRSLTLVVVTYVGFSLSIIAVIFLEATKVNNSNNTPSPIELPLFLTYTHTLSVT